MTLILILKRLVDYTSEHAATSNLIGPGVLFTPIRKHNFVGFLVGYLSCVIGFCKKNHHTEYWMTFYGSRSWL